MSIHTAPLLEREITKADLLHVTIPTAVETICHKYGISFDSNAEIWDDLRRIESELCEKLNQYNVPCATCGKARFVKSRSVKAVNGTDCSSCAAIKTWPERKRKMAERGTWPALVRMRKRKAASDKNNA